MQLRYIATTNDGSNLLFIYLFLTMVISWQIRSDNLLKLFPSSHDYNNGKIVAN